MFLEIFKTEKIFIYKIICCGNPNCMYAVHLLDMVRYTFKSKLGSQRKSLGIFTMTSWWGIDQRYKILSKGVSVCMSKKARNAEMRDPAGIATFLAALNQGTGRVARWKPLWIFQTALRAQSIRRKIHLYDTIVRSGRIKRQMQPNTKKGLQENPAQEFMWLRNRKTAWQWPKNTDQNTLEI